MVSRASPFLQKGTLEILIGDNAPKPMMKWVVSTPVSKFAPAGGVWVMLFREILKFTYFIGD